MKSLTLLDYYKTHNVLRNLERNAYYSDLIKKNKYDNVELAIDKIDQIVNNFQIMLDDVTVDKLAVFYNGGKHLFIKVSSNKYEGVVDYFYVYTSSTTLHLLGAEEDDEVFKVFDTNNTKGIDEEELIDDSPLGILLQGTNNPLEFAEGEIKETISFNSILNKIKDFMEVSYKQYMKYLKHYCNDKDYLTDMEAIKKRYLFKLFEDNKSSLFYDYGNEKAVRMPFSKGVLKHDLLTYKIKNLDGMKDETEFGVSLLNDSVYVVKNKTYDKTGNDFLIGESPVDKDPNKIRNIKVNIKEFSDTEDDANIHEYVDYLNYLAEENMLSLVMSPSRAKAFEIADPEYYISPNDLQEKKIKNLKLIIDELDYYIKNSQDKQQKEELIEFRNKISGKVSEVKDMNSEDCRRATNLMAEALKDEKLINKMILESKRNDKAIFSESNKLINDPLYIEYEEKLIKESMEDVKEYSKEKLSQMIAVFQKRLNNIKREYKDPEIKGAKLEKLMNDIYGVLLDIYAWTSSVNGLISTFFMAALSLVELGSEFKERTLEFLERRKVEIERELEEATGKKEEIFEKFLPQLERRIKDIREMRVRRMSKNLLHGESLSILDIIENRYSELKEMDNSLRNNKYYNESLNVVDDEVSVKSSKYKKEYKEIVNNEDKDSLVNSLYTLAKDIFNTILTFEEDSKGVQELESIYLSVLNTIYLNDDNFKDTVIERLEKDKVELQSKLNDPNIDDDEKLIYSDFVSRIETSIETLNHNKDLVSESVVSFHRLPRMDVTTDKFKKIINKYQGETIKGNEDKIVKDVKETYDSLFNEVASIHPHQLNFEYYSEGINIDIDRIKRKAVGVPKSIIDKLTKYKRKAEKIIANLRDNRRQRLKKKVINDEIVPFIDDILEWATAAAAGIASGAIGMQLTGMGGPIVGFVIFNPVVATIGAILMALIVKTGMKHRKDTRRKMAIRILEDEIEIIDEKIQDARNRDDTKTRDQLKRLQNQLEEKRDWIRVSNRIS